MANEEIITEEPLPTQEDNTPLTVEAEAMTDFKTIAEAESKRIAEYQALIIKAEEEAAAIIRINAINKAIEAAAKAEEEAKKSRL